jgi:RecG-like helicase
VVATIVPFDVNRITSTNAVPTLPAKSAVAPKVVTEKSKPVQEPQREFAPVTHYAEDVTPIGQIEWRKRSKVHGRVTSISTAPRGSAPMLQVEIWDETGGVTLNFLGRREIAGLEVGMEVRAEGMVGEEDGALTILNPSYELLI